MPDELKTIFYPDPHDDMWNLEVEKLIPWLKGSGVDIGSGDRSIYKSDMRVDIDKKRNVDVHLSGDDLSFKDEQFDYLYSIHSFEHFEYQRDLLIEWKRVIKKGGIIGIVHPDVNYTGIQKPIETNPDKNPFNKHTYERDLINWLKWFESQNLTRLEVIDSGIACQNWSFYVILKKKGEQL